MDKPAVERLLEIGFERAGYWELIDDELLICSEI